MKISKSEGRFGTMNISKDALERDFDQVLAVMRFVPFSVSEHEDVSGFYKMTGTSVLFKDGCTIDNAPQYLLRINNNCGVVTSVIAEDHANVKA
jgi:hypothetical protein